MQSHPRMVRPIARAIPVLALLAALLLSSSVHASNSNTRLHKPMMVGYIVKTLTNPFFVAMHPVAQAEARSLGATLIYEAGKYDGDNATQVSEIDDLITRGAGAIVVIPNLSSGIVPAVRRATAKHIAVLAVDTATSPPNAVTSFVATDNLKAGTLNGRWAKKAMGGKKAVIALLEGTPGSSVNTDRMGGFLQGFGPGSRGLVVKDLITNGDQAKAQTAMENALTARPDINLVWTVNEPAALGAATAIRARGMAGKITIVSMDGGCRGIRAVANGTIATDVMQFPRKMARLGVYYGVQAAMGHAIPRRIDTGEILVTKRPMMGVPNKSIAYGLKNCWG